MKHLHAFEKHADQRCEAFYELQDNKKNLPESMRMKGISLDSFWSKCTEPTCTVIAVWSPLSRRWIESTEVK